MVVAATAAALNEEAHSPQRWTVRNAMWAILSQASNLVHSG
jgi:hypothetical protein